MTRRQGILGSLGLAFVSSHGASAPPSPTGNPGASLSTVATRSSMVAMLGGQGRFAQLLEEGREGLFKWDGRDLSGAVKADPQQGIYMAPLNDASGASGAWVRQFTGPVYVNWFGATGDGEADDTPAIQSALDCGAAQVIIPPGQYRTRAPLQIDGNISIKGQGGHLKGAFIKPDASVLEALQFGKNGRYSGFVDSLFVERPTFDGETENTGFALYDVVNSTFSDCDSRRSKFPWRFKPGSRQRVSYTTFMNIRATFGLHNISVDLSGGDGYVNELVFVGGRCNTSENTVSNIYIDHNCNHWRFFAMSLEGAGAQAAYVGGTETQGTHSIVFDQCRTEGEWSNDDIVLESGTTLRCEIRGWNLYTTVTFDPQDNHLIQTASQNEVNSKASQASALTLRRNGLATDTPILDLVENYTSSGTTFGIRYAAKRGSGYLLQFLRGKTELVGWRLVDASQAILTNLGRAVFRRKSSDRERAIVTIQDEFASSGNANLMDLRTASERGTAISFSDHSTGTDQGGVEVVGTGVRFRSASSSHETAPLQLGGHHLWVDRSGQLRIKNGPPKADKDGKVVGANT